MTSDGVVELGDGSHLAFDDVGEGPAVVLVHPGLWDRRTWDDQMVSFPAAGFRTIRYDIRGYGSSSPLDGRPYAHHADLIALLDTLGVERAAIDVTLDGRRDRDRRDARASRACVGSGRGRVGPRWVRALA